MTALFTKTYSELREAFVHARFAEEQEFGNAHIESWLEEQRHAEKPAGDASESPWNRLLTLEEMLLAVQHGREIQILRRYAEPLGTLPRGSGDFIPDAEGRRWIKPILELFHDTKATLYYGNAWSGPLVLCTDHGGPRAFALDTQRDVRGNPTAIIQDVRATHVMDAIYASWLRGGPSAESARRFVCNVLAGVIAKARTRAEANFASAVAVSADGTKILHADNVLVVNDDHTRQLYGGTTFLHHKILRSNTIHRYMDDETSSCALQIIAEREAWIRFRRNCGNPVLDQILIANPQADSSLFVTTRRFCPYPLPPETK